MWYGVGLVDKPKITKLLQAVKDGNIALLASVVGEADHNLQDSFSMFLAYNPLPGSQEALKMLQLCSDPYTAVRSAAICLIGRR